jgi:putative transcriptional regulator
MFSENLKNFRKQKGLSQEELAERLHIVRQTVSKWEKGLSVPDAAMLIRVSEIFETSVSKLLGDTVEPSDDKNIIAQKLEQLNALLAEKNRRSRRIWKVIAATLISIAVVTALLIVLFLAYTYTYGDAPSAPIIIEQDALRIYPGKRQE